MDEVIYQEYSNTEATSLDYLASRNIDARFIDASSTEGNAPTQEPLGDRAPKSLLFGFLMSVLTAAVVGISVFFYYIYFETRLNCEG